MPDECQCCGLMPQENLDRIKDWSAGKVLEVCPICREEIREKNKLIAYEK